MSWLLEPFGYHYMLNAMWVSALVGGVCAFLSCYLMLKGWSLIGDALSHSIVPGVAGAYMLGLPFALGAFLSGGLAAGIVGGAALLALRPGLLKGYQFKRILAVLTPDDPALADITYQQNKGAMAIGTGGLTGQGLFSGEHIFVPNAWNDFIFAYLANVLGFVGAAAVLVLLLALCLRTLQTGLRCPDALGCNICVGIFAALFMQCVINLGMNLQVLPVIGVTLPFFSAGGSSVVMMYLCIGIVLSVGMNTRRSKLDMQRIL